MMIALLACSFSLPRDKSGRGVSSSSSHRRHSWRIVHHPRFGQQSTYVHCHVIPYRFELSLRLVCADRPTNQLPLTGIHSRSMVGVFLINTSRSFCGLVTHPSYNWMCTQPLMEGVSSSSNTNALSLDDGQSIDRF